jgi:hypothetical protein
MSKRIALIHATPVAMQPVVEAFRHGWTDIDTFSVLDDALSTDLARARPAVQQVIGNKALTSPESAVAKLKAVLNGQQL